MGLRLLSALALVFVATTARGVAASPSPPAPYYPPPPGEAITIVAFWIINPATGKWVHPLNATSTIHLAEGPIAVGAVVGPASASADGGASVMAADPDPGAPTYSVVWTTPKQWAHTDEAAPYLLAGDYRGRVRTVDLYPGTLRLGAYVNAGGGDPSQRERVLNVRVL